MPNDVIVRPRPRAYPAMRWLGGSRRAGSVSERALLVSFVGGLLALGAAIARWPHAVPISFLFPTVVVAGVVLRPRPLVMVYGIALVLVTGWVPHSGVGLTRSMFVAVSVGAVMAVMLIASVSRARIGTRGFRGDRMFAELRDRIALGGQLPDLPPGWQVSSCIRSAHGEHFSGDFLVAHRSPSGDRLEIVLVDVSGKGTRAGTRSLLLSGAFGGLLGAVPSDQFLATANDYLARQGWVEGFATAVHLEVDLRTGEYAIGNAGHPSAALFTFGKGRWEVIAGGRGPLLGVVPGAHFPRQRGWLGHGDTLLLYTDGIVEARGRDLVDGVDRMLGIATTTLLSQGDVAREVCSAARSGEDDDRAALAVRRL
jgi:hypothetical protein